MPRLLRFALVAVIMLLACATPASAALTIGIGDQKPGFFTDQAYANLQVNHVRFIMPYDEAAAGDFRRADTWMARARERGDTVLIAFNHGANAKRLPSDAVYRRAVLNTVRRYPWVREWSAWNEANHKSQPTQKNPRRAAQYYNIMRSTLAGGGRRIVAADVLDQGGMPAWIRTFRKTAKNPRIWGLHNYTETNKALVGRKRSGTARFAASVPGEVWITETGGIVRFSTRYRGGAAAETAAARSVTRSFQVARYSSRVKRVYLYNWDAGYTFQTWDSAVVDYDGRLRPGYYALRNAVNAERKRAGKALLQPLPVERR